MDLLTTILACSVYIGDDRLVRAIAEATPQGNPDFVLPATLDLTQVDPPPPPKTAGEAVARAAHIAADGGRPLLGLMELVPGWLDAFGRPLADAFDPCMNVAIGTSMLSAFDDECARSSRADHGAKGGKAPSTSRRSCVLHRYEDALGSPDFAGAVLLELRYERDAQADVLGAPIFAPSASQSGWSANSLLVPLPTPSQSARP